MRREEGGREWRKVEERDGCGGGGGGGLLTAKIEGGKGR